MIYTYQTMKRQYYNLKHYLERNGVRHVDETKISENIELHFGSLKAEVTVAFIALLGFALALTPLSGPEIVINMGYFILTGIMAVLCYFIVIQSEKMMRQGSPMIGRFLRMQWDRYQCIRNFGCDPLTTEEAVLKQKVIWKLKQMVAKIKKLTDCPDRTFLHSEYSDLRDIAKVWVKIPTCEELFK